jgi:hypothetical protein
MRDARLFIDALDRRDPIKPKGNAAGIDVPASPCLCALVRGNDIVLPELAPRSDQPAGVKPGTISNLAASSPMRDPATGENATVTAA